MKSMKSILSEKDAIITACRKANLVLSGTFGVHHPVGCGCPLTLFAETIGFDRFRQKNVKMYLEKAGYTGIMDFVRGFDGTAYLISPEWLAGQEVRHTLKEKVVDEHY